MATEIKCAIGTLKLNARNDFIVSCIHVRQQTIYSKDDVKLSFTRQTASTAIRFDECIMLSIPTSDTIKKFIPYLTIMNINNSKLSLITSEDLKGFDCLRDLYVMNCEIEHLPVDLFKYTPQLEIVSFYGNKIKYIDDGGILDPLQNLKSFSLLNNATINVKYDIINNKGNITLEQLKNEMKNKCSGTKRLNAEIGVLKAQNRMLTKFSNDQVKEIATLKENYEDLKHKLETVLQQFQVIKQISKDFTIKVNAKTYSVYKAVLITHSKVLAKLIAENPEAAELELKDISEATFTEILNFMNEGNFSSKDANMVELFGASCHLEIDALTAVVAGHLEEEVNQCNALNVLVLCNKFDKFNHYDELKMKAFAEFQKNFPNQTMSPKVASQSEKLMKLMAAKHQMDVMLDEMDQVD